MLALRHTRAGSRWSEHTVHLILGEMVHKGLAERETSQRRFRRKGISVFRAL